MTNIEKLEKIKELSNNAILFNDSSDYLSALWDILMISDDTKDENELYTEYDLSFIE